MSALSIQLPFTLFADSDGQPLEGGYVWIGQANLDPRTNPLATYFDKDLTIPAPQPLRTRGGYVVYAGSPAQIYVGADNYSILVQNKNGLSIYSFPQGTGTAADLRANLALPTGAAMVGKDGGGTVQDAIDALESAIDALESAPQDAVNVLRLIPPAEWPAIFAKTSTYNATTALQTALTTGGDIYIPDGLYNTGPLTASTTVPTTITMGPGVDIYAIAGYGINDRMLVAGLGARLTIHGNGAIMRMRKADYTTSEQRHVIASYGAALLHCYNLRAADSGGDGFYIGGVENQPTIDALLMHCKADNNRRQGASVVNAIKCHIIGGIYENTSGTDPQCGIDVESNLLPGYYLSDILIQGVRTKNNNGGGILVTPQSMANPVNITVRDCVSEGDGVRGGLSISAAMAYRTVAPVTDPANIGKITGRVYVDNITIINPQGRGFNMVNWTENAPDTHIGTVTVINPGSNPAYTADRDRCAFLIRGENGSGGSYGTSIGNFRMDNLVAVDNRATKIMRIPIYFENANEANTPLKRVQIGNIDAEKSEWTSVALGPILWGATKAEDFRVAYRKPPKLLLSGSTTLNGQHAGCTLYPTASATYTLPLAADYLGMEVEVWVKNAGTLNLTPNAADVIDIYSGGVVGNVATSNTVGSKLRVRASEAGRWEVVNVVGTWA